MIKTKKLSTKEFDELSRPLANDLTAYFKLIEEDIYKLLTSNKTEDELIKDINDLFED